jgi:molybdopterin synthase catalytic subunit
MADQPVRLIGLREQEIAVGEVLAAVADPTAGGHAIFVGTVRDHDGGRDVSKLIYTAHPSADASLRAVAEDVAAMPGVVAVAGLHRVGALTIGDTTVVLAVSAAHRGAAFDACRGFIDTLKERVPVWKEQVFADGETEWVDHA